MTEVGFDIQLMFAALLPDGSVLIEIAASNDDRLVKVTMPSSPYARKLAQETMVPLDLDELPNVAPQLAGEIDWFVSELRDRLVARAVQSGR